MQTFLICAAGIVATLFVAMIVMILGQIEWLPVITQPDGFAGHLYSYDLINNQEAYFDLIMKIGVVSVPLLMLANGLRHVWNWIKVSPRTKFLFKD
jgi:hypothetical protein